MLLLPKFFYKFLDVVRELFTFSKQAPITKTAPEVPGIEFAINYLGTYTEVIIKGEGWIKRPCTVGSSWHADRFITRLYEFLQQQQISMVHVHPKEFLFIGLHYGYYEEKDAVRIAEWLLGQGASKNNEVLFPEE